jgi:hypothetical protein
VSSDLQAYAASLRRHVFVDEGAIDAITRDASEGKISDTIAMDQLRALETGARGGPLYLSARQVNEEWSHLLAAMEQEAASWQRVARSQFALGFLLLPLVVVVVIGVLLYLSLKLPGDELAVAAEPLLGACLAAVATHAFLVFRVHQQARVAAERLSEKRAAILFMRLAVGRANPAEVAQLLQAGTAMFLGHHAIPAVPLQPSDSPAVPRVPAQRDSG